jgi:hypothetical protein
MKDTLRLFESHRQAMLARRKNLLSEPARQIGDPALKQSKCAPGRDRLLSAEPSALTRRLGFGMEQFAVPRRT